MTYPYTPPPGPRPGPPPPPAAPPSAYAGSSDDDRGPEETGHPAVDAALRSLANAAQLAPGEQIDAYEAAHQVLQETLASIDR
jgi:hypothetical protein